MKRWIWLVAGASVLAVAVVVAVLVTRPKPESAPPPPSMPPAAEFTSIATNPYFPLKPGMRWVYEGKDDRGRTERVVVEVLAATRTVAGVECAVVRDVVSINGVPVEDTLDWFAQDSAGNVWYLGEEVRDLRDGVVVGTSGSWEAGVNGAQAGIIMMAQPAVGQRYRQEYYPGHAEDAGEVLATDATVQTPFGRFNQVVQTRDYSPLEPGVAEHKFYAPGVGLVRSVHVSGEAGQVELIEFTNG